MTTTDMNAGTISAVRAYELQQTLLGGPAVYPGHPLTLGLLIMEAYPDLAAAKARPDAKPGASYPPAPAALASSLPGAGGCMYSALDLLARIQDGRLTPEEAVEFARTDWRGLNHPGAVEPGQEQADRVADRFIEQARAWCRDAAPAMTPR